MSNLETRLYNGYKQYKTDGSWKFTHRRVAEKLLGKKIPTNHEVHHINKNTLDNRPENLAVLTKEEHRKIHSDNNNVANIAISSIIYGIYSSLYIDAYKRIMSQVSIRMELFAKKERIELINKKIKMVKKSIIFLESLDQAGKIPIEGLNCNKLNKELEDTYLEIEILESKLRDLS